VTTRARTAYNGRTKGAVHGDDSDGRGVVLGAKRECDVDLSEVDEICPVLIGYIPLELLDFVVDPIGQRLIGDPRHNGEQVIDSM
jgi:hypothetical protein